MNKTIWISPSDLSYFWSDSKVGFFDKYVLEIYRPKQAFPSVFNTIDGAMKECFDRKATHDIVEHCPPGLFSHDEIIVQSKTIDLGDFKIGFKGKMDCLIQHEDGNVTIIDYKTTHLSNKLKDIYFLQLMAYAFSIENPLYGEPKTIKNLGLIVFQPKTFSVENNQGNLQGDLHYVDIPFDKNQFKKWIVNELKPLIHSQREQITLSSSDKSWEKYVNCFYVEEVEENEHN